MKRFYISLLLFFMSLSLSAQVKVDTIRLYLGGPKYIVNYEKYPSYGRSCNDYTTNEAYKYFADSLKGLGYQYPAGTKVKLGNHADLTFRSETKIPIKKDYYKRVDTIPTDKILAEFLEIRGYYDSSDVVSYMSGPEFQETPIEWLYILCENTRGKDSTFKTFRVIVENKPKALKNDLKICSLSPTLNLYTNVDNPGGLFYVGKFGDSYLQSLPVRSGQFNPRDHPTGKYVVYYKKEYLNDPTASTIISFTVDIGATALNFTASKDSIPLGDLVSFQSTSTLLTGDEITSTEWDFGDASAPSKLSTPTHFYTQSGTFTITIKQATKLGCNQTLSKKAVVVKSIPAGQGTKPQVLDTIVLVAGGSNYLMKKTGYVSSKALPSCTNYQTDAYYANAVEDILFKSNKTAIGDISNFPGPYTSDDFSVKSTVPIKTSKIVGSDTILAQQPIVGMVEIVQLTKTLQPYVSVIGTKQAGNYKAWTLINCNATSIETSVLKYRVIVENKPKALLSEYKICKSSSAVNLVSNLDNAGGTFTIGSLGTSYASSLQLAGGVFDPSKFAVGKYTVYYKKNYDNDPLSSTLISFTVDLIIGDNSLSFKASKDTILRGDLVSFQATSTLPTGDEITSTEWDFGDLSSVSKMANPSHFYLQSGSYNVTVKQSTKLGCIQTFTKKAVVVKPIPVGIGTKPQIVDTIVLFIGGSNYPMKKTGYVSTEPIAACNYYQTDAYYANAVEALLANSNKTSIGDITNFPGPYTSDAFTIKSTVPIKSNKVMGSDTILAQQPIVGIVEITQSTKTLQPYVTITGTKQVGNYKAWTQISCNALSKESSALNYLVIVENKPKALVAEYKICKSSSPINLSANVDNAGGSFTIGPLGVTYASSTPLPGGLFDPVLYTIGKYTVYYKKIYDNDPLAATLLSFTVDLSIGNNTLNFKASKDTIKQGEAVSFQATSVLSSGDEITVTEWEFGDKTTTSKLPVPYHYYLDTGSISVTVRQSTKLGCALSFTKKAVYVKPVKIDIKTEANGPYAFSYENKNENDLRLYPNPVKTTFHLTAFVPLEHVTLLLRRALDGEKLFEKKYAWLEQVEIDMTPHAAGLYIMQLKSATGEIKNFKLIKE